ncbi:MAG TPA: hypothetical protein VIT20_02845 [Propionibacteriaceae bacterium]
MNLGSDDRRTLQLGPLWVLSALAGTSRFSRYELEAFWDGVVGVTLRTPEPARGLLVSLAADRSGLVLDFELDDRSVVTGLAHVVAALARLESEVSADFRRALLRIGMAVGRARGPYGRQITFEDTQMLMMVAQLLEIEAVPPVGDEVLV